MIDAIVHYRGSGSERRHLAAVPAAGAYVFGPGAAGRLWQVSAVALDDQATQVYALEVSPRLAGELQEAWATWGEGEAAAPDEAPLAEAGRRGGWG